MSHAWLKGPLILLSLPAAVFLQATLLANSLPGEVTPNLVFLLTVAAGYLLGAVGGVCSGMWAGALTGAAVGSLAVPYSCLYGFLGWLAGLHIERRPKAWTLPVVCVCLMVMLMTGESLVSLWLEGQQPSLAFKLANIAWMTLASVFFYVLGTGKKRGHDS